MNCILLSVANRTSILSAISIVGHSTRKDWRNFDFMGCMCRDASLQEKARATFRVSVDQDWENFVSSLHRAPETGLRPTESGPGQAFFSGPNAEATMLNTMSGKSQIFLEFNIVFPRQVHPCAECLNGISECPTADQPKKHLDHLDEIID